MSDHHVSPGLEPTAYEATVRDACPAPELGKVELPPLGECDLVEVGQGCRRSCRRETSPKQLRDGALPGTDGTGDRDETAHPATVPTAPGAVPVAGPGLALHVHDRETACQRAGHALSQREDDADRWIAATAIRLGLPLVSNDGVFENTPGLRLETARG